MNKLKIVVIGGGSSYTPELIEGFIKRYDEFKITEVWLVDVLLGAEKLKIIYELTKRMFRRANLDVQVFMTLDRKMALKDADFVMTQFRVGGLEARILDERIPGKYQMLGQETNGAGGLFKALRTVPVIFSIIEDIKEVAKDAWVINFTNPAGVVSEAVFRYTDFKRFIGVCNVPINLTNHFASVLKVKPNEILPIFAGLNHMSYVLNVYKGQEDLLDRIIDSVGENDANMSNISTLNWNKQFIKSLGVYPNPYHKYYYFYEEMFAKYYKDFELGKTRAEFVKEVEHDLFLKYQDLALDVKPQELEKRGGAYYSDVACNIISAIYNDKNEYHVVNTVNGSSIKEIDSLSAIEVTARINKDGAFPVKIGKLKESIKGIIISIKNYEKTLVDAIYHKDLNKALLAFEIHPLTKSINNAKLVFDELVVAHKKYLSYYFKGESK